MPRKKRPLAPDDPIWKEWDALMRRIADGERINSLTEDDLAYIRRDRIAELYANDEIERTDQ